MISPYSAVKLGALLLGALLLFVLAGTTVMFATEPGRLWVAHAVIDRVNQSASLNISVEALKSPELGHWQAQAIQLDKASQSWIAVEQIDLTWRPSALLGKALVVDELHAQRFSVYKMPPTNPLEGQSADNESEKTESSENLNIPDIQIGLLEIDAFELRGFIGSLNDQQNLSYQVRATAELQKHSPLYVHFEAHGLGALPTSLEIEITSENWTHAMIEGSISEPAGGFLGNRLYLPEDQAIDAGLTVGLTNNNERYTANIESLSFPLSKRQVSAQGAISLVAESNEILVDELTLDIDETQHRINGKLSKQLIDLNIDIDQFPLDITSPWYAALNNGQLTTQLVVTGTADEPQAEGNLSANIVYNNLPIDLNFSGLAQRDQLLIDDLAATLGQAAVSASGGIDFVSGEDELDVEVTDLDIASLRALFVSLPEALSGKLTSELTVSGTAARPEAEGQLTANIRYNELPIDLELTAKADRRLLDIENLVANIDQSEVVLKGIVDLVADTSAIKLSADNLDISTLDRFQIHRPADLNATLVKVDANLTGPLRSPNGELAYRVTGDYKGQNFQSQGQLRKEINALFIQDSSIETGGGNIAIDGDLQIDTLIANLAVHAKEMPLDMLALAGVKLPESLSASLDAELSLNGNLRLPQVDGEAKLSGNYEDIPFVFEAEGYYQDRSARLDSLRVQAFSELVLTAGGFYQSGEFDVGIHARQLPTQLLSAVGWHIQPGNFNTEFQAMGTLADPKLRGTLDYEAVLQGYDANGDQQDINFRWDLDVATTDSSISFESMFTRNDHPPGELLLSFPIQPYRDFFTNQQAITTAVDFEALPFYASLLGKFNLQTVSFLFDPDLHRLGGEFETDMNFSGTLSKPAMNGIYQARNASYENVVTGTVVQNIQCLIEATQATLGVENCSANDRDEGAYSLTGDMRLPIDGTNGIVDLTLAVQEANVLRRSDIESEATGEIRLVGDFDSLLASGQLNLSPMTVSLDANYSSGIPTIRVEEEDSLQENLGQNQRRQSVLPNINFDLILGADRQAYLRGRGLEAELQGQVAIYGNLKKPLYEGDAETVRGSFEIFNKKFELEQGNVNFANNAIGLAITGVYEKDSQVIRAVLSGSSDDLKLTLSAIPVIPEDEILAFIIFGKSIQEVTPFEAIQLASAVQSLRGGGNSFFDPIGSIREFLGVDAFSLESAEDDEGQTGVNVGVGKYLNEHVYLEVERTPSESQPWKGNIEIELTPNLNLESSTGGKTGIEGAELKWKRDY